MNRPRIVTTTLTTSLALGVLLAGISAVHAPQALAHPATSKSMYSFTTYAYPHDTFTQLLSINNNGRIAGYHGEKENKGFTLTLPGSMQSENFPKSAQTQVIGINNHGDTAGFCVDGKGVTHGFLQNGAIHRWMTTDVAGTDFNQLLGVNDQGIATGYYQFGKAAIFQPFTRLSGGAFRLPPIPNAQMTDINNSQNITGFQVQSSSMSRAFVVEGSKVQYFQYPGASVTQALGLNNQGVVVGTYNDKAGNAHGFTYNTGTRAFRSVNVPNSTATVVNGLNDHGWLVGFYTAPNKHTIGFVAKPGA